MILPEAKQYFAKRERARLLEEQLGYTSGRNNQTKSHNMLFNATNIEDEPHQYIELKELNRGANNTTNANTSV